MVSNNIAIGLEYLYTDLKDKDYVVSVGQGTANHAHAATAADSQAGTQGGRSDMA